MGGSSGRGFLRPRAIGYAMRAIAVATVALLPLVAGCALLAEPCHAFPASAGGALPDGTERASIRAALVADGWTLAADEPGAAVVAHKPHEGHAATARGFHDGQGPSGQAWLEVEGGPASAQTSEAAAEALAPLAEPLFARLGAQPPTYTPATRHCGSV